MGNQGIALPPSFITTGASFNRIASAFESG